MATATLSIWGSLGAHVALSRCFVFLSRARTNAPTITRAASVAPPIAPMIAAVTTSGQPIPSMAATVSDVAIAQC